MTWLPTVVSTPPLTEPVSLAEAKAQCRVDGNDSDAELTLYISAARTLVEEYTGTKLVSQTVLMQGSAFCDLWSLPAAPIISVTSVKYLDPDGVEQTLSTDIYENVLVGLKPHIRRKVAQYWPALRPCASDAVRVVAVAGYAPLPAPIKSAILLIISSWFDSRDVGPVPDGAYSLLANHRRF